MPGHDQQTFNITYLLMIRKMGLSTEFLSAVLHPCIQSTQALLTAVVLRWISPHCLRSLTIHAVLLLNGSTMAMEGKYALISLHYETVGSYYHAIIIILNYSTWWVRLCSSSLILFHSNWMVSASSTKWNRDKLYSTYQLHQWICSGRQDCQWEQKILSSNPYQVVAISISASTAIGEGPATNCLFVRTLQDSKKIIVLLVDHRSLHMHRSWSSTEYNGNSISTVCC